MRFDSVDALTVKQPTVSKNCKKQDRQQTNISIF